jgi:hypothetical protein
MQRLAKIAFLFLVLPTHGFSQEWLSNGNNIYNANSGNIGIGTTSPTSKLDVNGQAKIGGVLFNQSINIDGSVYYAPQSYIEAGTLPPQATLNHPEVISYTQLNNTNSPFSRAMLFNGYSEGHISDYIPVQAGETLYGEIWAMRETGSNGTTGLLYYGVSMYDKDKYLINDNVGLAYLFGGITVPENGIWQKYSGSYTLPTSHSPYNGSDGGPVRYIKVYLIVNYPIYPSVPTLINGPILRRQNLYRDTGAIVINGNLGIGTAAPLAKLDINGNVNVSGNISAKYQDVAEWVKSDLPIEAGTVVITDPDRPDRVLPSNEAYDMRVAGVVSAEPGIVLGEAGEGKVKVATTGRIMVRVNALKYPIIIGDLLVTSDIEGMAMKSEAIEIGNGRKIHQPGTIIGKALEPISGAIGEIKVLLCLQ